MSASGREALPVVWEWLGGPPKCLGVVRRPSRLSGSDQKAFPVVREWSGDPSK